MAATWPGLKSGWARKRPPGPSLSRGIHRPRWKWAAVNSGSPYRRSRAGTSEFGEGGRFRGISRQAMTMVNAGCRCHPRLRPNGQGRLSPGLWTLYAAVDGISREVRRAATPRIPLIVFESTLAPTSLATLIKKRFQESGLIEGVDILLGNSPNRVMRGGSSRRMNLRTRSLAP